MHKNRTQPTDTKNQLTRRDFLSTSLKAGAAVFTTGLLPRLRARAAGQYNVLFISVDDLRPLLGCYGHPEMHTPNIDALAARGMLFNRAYCQFPVCNPSRASVLTGLRPDTIRVYDNPTDFREVLPDAVTLPQHFKEHGYHTRSVGKIAHGAAAWEDELSWSAPIWRQRWKAIDKTTSPSWQALDVADDELDDGKIANAAIQVLNEIKDRLFFLAVGFNKPHLPFYAPSKYFELYTPQDFAVPVDSSLPLNAPTLASNPKSLKAYHDIPHNPPLSDELTLELTRAYAANVSYVDALVGRILTQLDTLRLTQNTAIVFWGDHGFHLGEHGCWRKNTLFEASLRSPLVVSMPEQARAAASSDALVELVDIFPTLCDMCHLPPPSELEGSSLVPLLEQPNTPWKPAVFSQLKRGTINGYSMRTERYRYTEWGNNGNRGKELYDYQTDPHETENIAPLTENAALVAQLSEQLKSGYLQAMPGMEEAVSVGQTLREDINNDGVVDIRDLVRVANKFGESGGTAIPEDVNNDGVVDIRDLVRVANHFGKQ